MLGRLDRRVAVALLAVLTLLAGACSSSTADDGTPPVTADDGPASPRPSPPASTPSPAPSAEAEPAPAPEPTTPPIPPEPPSRPALVQRLEHLVAAAERATDAAELGVVVVDEHGRVLVEHRADEPLLPASTLKIVTAASVLTTLGPDHRLATRVETTAPIGPGGVVDGTLVLVGSGDPALGTPEYGRWVYPARPRTPLEALADQLVAAGVTQLTGGIVGTSQGFEGPATADGWKDGYFSSLDARHVSGLTVDGGLATLVRYPRPEGDGDGEPAQDTGGETGAETGDEVEGVSWEERVRAMSPEERAALGAPDVRVQLTTDPARHAAAELARLLEDRGVEVAGETRSEPLDSVPVVGRLAVVESPPMEELLRFAVQRSDNHLTDQLFQVVARARTGTGSWANGERALRQVLERLGIDHTGARFADGSGLSRQDRATARLLAEVDRAMYTGRHGELWRELQAVMGESGTLARRLHGTPAAGRFAGKTGTLDDVTGLSGAVLGDDGDRYHLAVLANEARGADRAVARALMDEVILALVADVQSCAVVAAPGAEPGPLDTIPSVLDCR